nr:RNA-directed DNA polymerase, eukaryota [Tanacetum cinerariifolium]
MYMLEHGVILQYVRTTTHMMICMKNDYGGFNVHESGSCGGDSDVEGVLETIFEESGQKENNFDEEHTDKQENHLGDPFSIYKLLKKNKDNVEKENNSEHNMKYPPGCTPKEGTDVVGMHAKESKSDNIVNLSDHNAEEVNNTFSGNYPKKNSKEDVSNSAKKDWVKELCVKNMGNFLALQETKMENMKLFSVKMCWGNFSFDYVHSDSVGNSGGILCVCDPNSFRKSNATVYDYFIMIWGVWRKTGNDLLIIAVYAPHDLKDKQMLWEYLTYEFGKWKGEVVTMGDFYEVRYKSDRFGSMFNVQGANVFNSFITNVGLEEALEAIMDKGDGHVEVVNKRMEVVNTLQKIDKICSSEMAQKAKVELESDVSNEEIKRAVWDCGIDKSPGSDGFTFGCNSSFIALIPKVPDANTVKDFRPISLIGSLYKIVAKILANRLVGVLGDIVNEEQSAFITGRQILDCPFILNEASGLRINMSKSKIIGVLVDSDKVKCVASKLGCLILKTLLSYLGSKVGGFMSRVHTWNEVVDRVKNRLSKWKMKTLSIGGRFYAQNTSLWVRVIKAIHGDDGKVGGYVKDGAKSCWLSIVNEINSLKNKGKALKNLYQRIYSLETCKLITVGMKLAQTSLDFLFRRVPRGGVEQEQFNELSTLVHDVTLIPMLDRWIWALESSGDFFVTSVRKVINDKSLPEVDSKTRWIKYVPINVNVHAWKVNTDSLPTRFNVSRRSIHIDSIMYDICDKGAETSSNLFFSCCMARQTVRMITRWWDVLYGEYLFEASLDRQRWICLLSSTMQIQPSVYDRGNANAHVDGNDNVNEEGNDVVEAGHTEQGDHVFDVEGIDIIADDEIQAIIADQPKRVRKKRLAAYGTGGSGLPPKTLKKVYGNSRDAGASVAIKSLTTSQGLLDSSTLAVEVGVTATATH